jgi:hypothetical protein
MGSRSVRAGPFAGLTVGAGCDGMLQARGSDDTSRGASVADPACRFYRCGPTRAGGLPRPSARPHSALTCAPAAPRVHQAELPGASRQAAPSPVFTRAVHPVHCRAEAFPSGRRPLMNDIGANEALGPLRTRSARPCGSQTESGPNLEHWKTVATSLRAR